jgi:hypothetical protein
MLKFYLSNESKTKFNNHKKINKLEFVILIGPPHALDPFIGRKMEARRDQDRRLNRNHM